MGTGIDKAPWGAQQSRERLHDWAGAGPHELHRRADALEAASVRAYRCRRELATVVLHAERRADAAARLDAALRRPVAA
jgi:hypothetical protein